MNFVGTSAYMPPECVRNKGCFLASDIWSLGCLLYQLYVGFLPFRGGSDYLIFERSTQLNYNLPMASLPEKVLPLVAKDLILSMLKIDYSERPTIAEVLSHPFFEEIERLQTT
jgi:3-phosphoinositide dependent protein kinase-1